MTNDGEPSQPRGTSLELAHEMRRDKAIDIAYSSSRKDNEDRGIRGRGHPRNDLNDLKVKAPKFDGNLKPRNYINWVQAIERIIEVKE